MRPTIDQQVTFLYTHDLPATADFYRTILQLPLVLDQGGCQIFRTSGSSFLGICQTDRPIDPDGIIVTLVSGEVDAWYDYLRDRQITPEKPPTYNQQYNIYHLFLRDPAGYLIEIQTFRDPAWPQA